MNFLNNRLVSRIVSIGLLGICLAGCSSMQGVDVLTWSNDAKRQGMQQYNDGRYAEAAGCFRNAIRQNPIDMRNPHFRQHIHREGGAWWDEYFYALLAEEYFARAERPADPRPA